MQKLPIATSIVRKLQDMGHTAYFAGGWVRDLIMDHPSDDIDIATSASVEEIQKIFPKTIPVGISFGIVVVVEKESLFEVATFRKDLPYTDGRRPTGFKKTSAQEDALRRDFTINGMFYDPIDHKLYDYVEGQADIERKVIRAIGDPKLRFQEDRLRMMRAVRYATRFGFAIEEATKNAILEEASSLLPAVAMERIWQEFKKMAQFSHFDEGLAELQRLKLLSVIFPELKNIPPAEIEHRLLCVENFPKEAPPIAELLELFPEKSIQAKLSIASYLKLPKEDKAFIQKLGYSFEMLTMPEDWQANLEPVEWARFYADPYSDLCLDIFAARLEATQKESFLRTHSGRKKALFRFIERIKRKIFLVTSEDLFKEGIPKGPLMGKLLKEAERLSINFSLEEKDELLSLLKNSSSWPSL